jgi:hypothetical protein
MSSPPKPTSPAPSKIPGPALMKGFLPYDLWPYPLPVNPLAAQTGLSILHSCGLMSKFRLRAALTLRA